MSASIILDEHALKGYGYSSYLRKAHNVALEERLFALYQNYWTVNLAGSVTPHPSALTRAFWTRKITETRAELHNRGKVLAVGVEETEVLGSVTIRPEVIAVMRDRRLPARSYLVRYSKAPFIRDSLEKGRFRIAPAGTYADPSLNKAQCDEELSHFAVTAQRHVAMKIYGFLSGEDQSQTREMPFESLELFEYINTSNFYVLCMDNQFDIRMFEDFEADAALIIRRPNKFSQRLMQAVLREQPTFTCKQGDAHYYDPYTVAKNNLRPGFSKNFAFSNQNEYRMIWWPRDSSTQIEPFFVEAGNLSDIAEAVFI